jgi:hypothetical protein
MIKYFGTDLTQAGHYMWQLDGNAMGKFYERGYFFSSIPFNPEKFPRETQTKGKHEFGRIEWNGKHYTILAICGAPSDERGGTKMVFWVEESVTYVELMARIKATPIAMKLINKCPFPIPLFEKP